MIDSREQRDDDPQNFFCLVRTRCNLSQTRGGRALGEEHTIPIWCSRKLLEKRPAHESCRGIWYLSPDSRVYPWGLDTWKICCTITRVVFRWAWLLPPLTSRTTSALSLLPQNHHDRSKLSWQNDDKLHRMPFHKYFSHIFFMQLCRKCVYHRVEDFDLLP